MKKLIEPHMYHIRKEYLNRTYYDEDKGWAIMSMCGRYMYENGMPMSEGYCDTCQRIFERDYEMCQASDENSHLKEKRDECECMEGDAYE